ncbi:hypothetical protein BH11MYX2_BH11MYX2_00110 [soil metagenome]
MRAALETSDGLLSRTAWRSRISYLFLEARVETVEVLAVPQQLWLLEHLGAVHELMLGDRRGADLPHEITLLPRQAAGSLLHLQRERLDRVERLGQTVPRPTNRDEAHRRANENIGRIFARSPT